jgi:hypothetical protein
MPANRQGKGDFFNYAELFNSKSQRTVAAERGAQSADAAPAKAPAAPVAGQQNIFTGLCEALNQHQQELIKQKLREIPDQYAIRFDPPAMGQATIKRPGFQNLDQAPMRNNDTAKKLDSEKDNVNRSAMTWTVKAGAQIVQVIDNVLRNSSYITDQQIVQVSPVADPKTGVQKQVSSPGTKTGTTAWYKITVAVEQLGVDNIIRDHAYRMTFIVTPYAVAQLASQYFPDSRYRGVHKSYQYWFTGNNTQILQYEQKYSNAYRLTLTGLGVDLQKEGSTNFRDQWRKIYMATSENHAQGAKDYTNEPGDNAASFLYDPMSLANVKLRIVGDPAWMQQGEVGLGQVARNFNFSPFLPDGSINYDSQAIMFDISFNQPTDYDFNTGVVNVNAHNSSSGLPQEHYTYTATKCKSIFSKGRFEQEIEGKLLVEYNQNSTTNNNGRSTAPVATTSPSSTAVGSREQTTAQNTESTAPDDGSRGYAIQDETGQVSNIRKNEYGDLYYPVTPGPAAPPAAPTSSGDISSPRPANADIITGEVNTTTYTPVQNPDGTYQAPPLIGQLQLNNGRVASFYATDVAGYNKALASGATPVGPQKMNKEY